MFKIELDFTISLVPLSKSDISELKAFRTHSRLYLLARLCDLSILYFISVLTRFIISMKLKLLIPIDYYFILGQTKFKKKLSHSQQMRGSPNCDTEVEHKLYIRRSTFYCYVFFIRSGYKTLLVFHDWTICS